MCIYIPMQTFTLLASHSSVATQNLEEAQKLPLFDHGFRDDAPKGPP